MRTIVDFLLEIGSEALALAFVELTDVFITRAPGVFTFSVFHRVLHLALVNRPILAKVVS
jgi:hypothetical protein